MCFAKIWPLVFFGKARITFLMDFGVPKMGFLVFPLGVIRGGVLGCVYIQKFF